MKNTSNIEEMVTPQQNHNIDSLNGETNEHSMCEAQTLADAICDFNKTFKNEENFTSSWQQSHEEENCNEFSNEVNKLMKDNTMHEQHTQQCIPEKGLKTHGKQGEDAVLKETGQLHD